MSNAGFAFLYQTKTILRPHSVKRAALCYRPLSGSAPLCERRRPGRPLSLDRATQADVEPSFNPNTTLTPTEDRKFRAIFEAAAKGLPPPSIQKQEYKAEGPGNSEYKPGDSIDALFEKIGVDEQSAGTQSTENEASSAPTKDSPRQPPRQPTVRHLLRELSPDFPVALQGAWRDARRAMAAGTGHGSVTSTEQDMIQSQIVASQDNSLDLERRSADIARIQAAFDKAATDFEVWSVLEREVFPRACELIRVISARTRKEDAGGSRDSRTAAKNDTKGSKKKSDGGSGAQKSVAGRGHDTPDTIKSTYPIHLLNAMRRLRVAFPCSPYALALMQTVKQLGPVSQVLGLSTELYNELLFILWRQHSNIFECAKTVEDMNSQDLIGDQYTTALFRAAEHESKASQGLGSEISSVRRAWWQLNTVQDAMSRWQAAMDVLDARADEEIEYQNQWLQEQANATGANTSVFSDDFMAEESARDERRSKNIEETEMIAQAATG